MGRDTDRKRLRRVLGAGWALIGAAALSVTGCGGGGGETTTLVAIEAQSCMTCHNGSLHDDYSGPGLENPHPFPGADQLLCTDCHGGNPDGEDHIASHVPPPPEIGDDENLVEDTFAYFNRLTLTGIDKFDSYTVNGTTYSPIDYLQFINPGDLRVVDAGRSCGQCHQNHVECVADSLLATEAGILSGAMYAIGVDNRVVENQGLYEDTAADLGFRARTDPGFVHGVDPVGAIGSIQEHPVHSVLGAEGPTDIFKNDLYLSENLPADLLPNNQVVSGSPLENLYHEQIAFTCGDCHLGSAGANDRYGDFRSSGCTSCHMAYSLDGRSTSGDPHVDKFEPADPDRIEAPERPHIRRHMIQSVAQTLPSGEFVGGIDDYSCAGCHQGSNRTVMQYWGIRLDQNEDLRRGVQYPAMPVTFEDTRHDERLFDPVVRNDTFNGRRPQQYILHEDYDGDGRDDTPADVHYDAGMGCIDCHGSYDLHGGDVTTPGGNQILSRMEQAVAITCESCHGDASGYAPTTTATNYDGEAAEVAVDRLGNPLRHVEVDENGHYFMTSRLTGNRHYVVQTRDVVVDNGRAHPTSGDPLYSVLASYAMGRDDGDPNTGLGPQQSGSAPAGFAHADSMSCASCHASWTNTCIGCHLGGEYDQNDNFSNITGERIVFEQANADFVYQNPLHFQLGIGPKDQIEVISPNTETFWQYEDRKNVDSRIFAFSDRNGGGNDPAVEHPSLAHNVMMPHSIRGKVTATDEGPRYCVACHLTDEGLANFGDEYDTLRTALTTPGFPGLTEDFYRNVLQDHFGRNPGNQLNSPLWVHQVAGLGSGMYLFDENGCAINPLDEDDDRVGCDGQAPADHFDLGNVHFDLDGIVEADGTSAGSNNHAMLEPGNASSLRDGADDPELSGPLGATLIQRLTDPITGIVLDSWIDADGVPQGDAGDAVGTP